MTTRIPSRRPRHACGPPRTTSSDADEALEEASAAFCEDAEQYIDAVDRYGKLFTEGETTVGDVTTAADDLAEPRRAVESSAEDVTRGARGRGGGQRGARRGHGGAGDGPVLDDGGGDDHHRSPTSGSGDRRPGRRRPRTTSPTRPTASATTRRWSTPTTSLNAAAFALEVAWLRLFAEAGCLTSEQQAEAVTAVADYTTALQSQLQVAGFYDGPIDGVYGPSTVAAVEALQTDAGLPVTGFVDEATAAALSAAVSEVSGAAANEAVVHAAAVQSALKLAGYWPGAIDGQWTPELTEALKALQTDLGVEPTGEVDTATLRALERAIEEAGESQDQTTTTTADDDTTTTTES